MIEDIKRILKRELRRDEYERIAARLDIVQRDRDIRRDFLRLKKQYGAKAAIAKLAEKYYLSEAQIDYIVYPRNRS